jgi:drug/metabolite transporter (DMT)-like permease
MALCTNLLGGAGTVPFLEIAAVRFVVQAGASVATLCVSRRGSLGRLDTWLGERQHRWLMLQRGLWGVSGVLCYFYALTQLALSDASCLAFLNVPMTAVFARLLLGEPYSPLDGATAALAMVGVVLIAQPAALFGGDDGSGGGAVPWFAVLVCLLGSVTSSMAYITVRQLSGADAVVVTLYLSAVGAGVTALLMGGFRAVAPVTTAAEWGWLAVVGLAGFVGQVLLNRGLQRAPAGPAMAMRYTELCFTMTFQATVLHAPPAPLKLVGAGLVSSTVVAVFWRARRVKAAAAARAAAAAVKAGGQAEDEAEETASSGSGTGAPTSTTAADSESAGDLGPAAAAAASVACTRAADVAASSTVDGGLQECPRQDDHSAAHHHEREHETTALLPPQQLGLRVDDG